MSERFDLVVLGAGTAYRVAQKAAQAGKRVALVEKSRVGGTCPNRGCIPSKLILAHAEAARAVRRAAQFHVSARLEGIDGARVLKDMRESIAVVDESMSERLDDGIELVRGHARFVDAGTVEVEGRRLEAKAFVIATGARPVDPPSGLFGDLPYWTSDDVFGLEQLPHSLCVMGGGLVGCEMASFFAGMGTDTTLVQRGPDVLEREDADLRERARRVLEENGVSVRTATVVRAVRGSMAGIDLELEGEAAQNVTCSAVLVAVGRRPNTDDLGLEAAGVEIDERGNVVVDDHLRTSAPSIYAMGDLLGREPYTHAASHEAHYLVRALVEGREEPLEYGPVPHAVFLDPPLGSVGATEESLRARAVEYRVAKVEFGDMPMGRAHRDTHGLCKLLASPAGEILGAHLIGHEAISLLHQISAVMTLGGTTRDLARMITVVPAMAEVVSSAARELA